MLDGPVFVAGHNGLVGSAITRRLAAANHPNVILRSRRELDLTDQRAVDEFFYAHRPRYVFLAAARVGGILANQTRPAEFIRNNLLIQTNVIDAAYRNGTAKLLFLGSSCIYPKYAEQPIRESYLLTGPLETTNKAYAVAKIAGIEMAQCYRRQYGFDAICLMPSNVYGPGDNFDLETSHVVPALIRKFHEAKVSGGDQVAVWGTGKARREFLHADDLADAAVYLMERYSAEEIINIGWGEDISLRDLAEIIRRVVGCSAEIVLDTSKPDGTPGKLLDVSRLGQLGWRPKISLAEGIGQTYRWYGTRHRSRGRHEECIRG